jgi:uncharacterized protein (DUF2267 family)
MSEIINPFNKMYEEANVWLKDLAERMGHNDRKHAYHALRGVLFALRDRMPVAEVFQFSAQLPTVLRGMFFEGYVPAGKPEKLHLEEFLERVGVEVRTVNAGDPMEAASAVFAFLKARMGEKALANIANVLPRDLQELLRAA